MSSNTEGRPLLRPLSAGIALASVFLAALTFPLQAASQLELSSAETSAWIAVVWGLPATLSIFFIARYRQPLVLTGNIFILIFVLLLGGELAWSELIGATMVAGAIVLVLGVTGLTQRLVGFLPPAIVYGLLAGAVLRLFAETFTALGQSTLIVGVTLAAYFLSRATLGDRVPALLVALTAGIAVAVFASETGAVPDPVWPSVTLTSPSFDLGAILTATPVLVVFITLQANAPSIVFLRSQAYEPPEKALSVVSGLATMAGSIFGPMGVSLSLPSTALVASPDAGDFDLRRWAAVTAVACSLLIAAAAGFAAELIAFIPEALLDAVVGLAVLGIFVGALQEVTSGPLRIGPVVAFGVSVSSIELVGLGSFFWAIALGLTVSLLLEREGWKKLLGERTTP